MAKKQTADSITIEIHAPISFPRYLKPLLKKASRFTLQALPVTELKKLTAPFPYTLHISIVSPLKSQKLNLKYRKKNKPTDVLSFSRLEGPQMPTPAPEVGDVIICYSVAKNQAKEYETSLADELQRLVVHGVLHLFGYDHEKTKSEAKRMFKLQDKILAKL